MLTLAKRLALNRQYWLLSARLQDLQTFSVRACTRMRTRAGAAIFLQIGAPKCSEMCVRVRAYISFKVRTWARKSTLQFLVKKKIGPFLAKKKYLFEIFFGKNVRVPHTYKMCVMCVRVRTKIRAH